MNRTLIIRRKLRQAQIVFESALEMQATAEGLFAEARRLVDEIQDMREGGPLPLPRSGRAILATRPTVGR